MSDHSVQQRVFFNSKAAPVKFLQLRMQQIQKDSTPGTALCCCVWILCSSLPYVTLRVAFRIMSAIVPRKRT
jgi:hypothetical protein